jgi:lysophospholipase L1-like esterase
MDDSKREEIAQSTADEQKSRRHTPSRKPRIGLIVAALAITLVVLEITLRSMGFAHYFDKDLEAANHAEDAFVIICLGDSSTLGEIDGTDRYSYPSQLETLLNSRHPDREYCLVNLGVPGVNSSQIARRFEGYIRKYDPDMAILLLGNNDVWNRNESRMWLVAEGEEAGLSDRLTARLRYLGDSLRVVHLMRTLATTLHDTRPVPWNAMAHASPSFHNFKKSLAVLGDVERVEALYQLNFNQISTLARKHNVDLLWLDYPVGAKYGETAYVGPVIKSLDDDSLDLFPLFHDAPQPKGPMREERDTVRRDLLHADLWHPTAEGYTLFARAIYNKLVEMGHTFGPPVAMDDPIQPYE